MCWGRLANVLENCRGLQRPWHNQGRLITKGMQKRVKTREPREWIKAHPSRPLQLRSPRNTPFEGLPIPRH